MTPNTPPKWDLNVLYNGFSDPRIKTMLESLKKEAMSFNEKYKGKIGKSLVIESGLTVIFITRDEILQKLQELEIFASLNVSADQTNKEALTFMNMIQNETNTIRKYLSFFDLDIAHLLRRRKSLIQNPKNVQIKHQLEKIDRIRPHQLSQLEENLIIEKNRYGRDEWSQLAYQWLGSKKFTLNIHNQEIVLPWVSARKYFSDSDHNVRKEAYSKVLGNLGVDGELYATALRNICAIAIADCKNRMYQSVLEASFLANDINEEIFNSLLTVVEENVHIFQNFLRLKAKLLGTTILNGEDLTAPLPNDIDLSISWEETRELIIRIFNDFDKEFGSIVTEMFEKNRIDAFPNAGKSAASFTEPWYTGKSAFLLTSFNGKLDDAKILAHELFHAIHAKLGSSMQLYNSYNPPFVLAESAGEFGTMLFTDKFLEHFPDMQVKRSILFKALEKSLNEIFEVSSRVRFEESLYQAIKNGDYLNAAKINDLFGQARKKFFGDAIVFLPEQNYDWMWKPHYFVPDVRFYNYPYVFGELLVLSLYNKYRVEGAEQFIPKYKEFLSAGNAISPEELLLKLDIDLRSKSFWQSGMIELQRLLDELTNLF